MLTSCSTTWRSTAVVFREVGVVEVREVLRGWLDGVGLRTVAARAGVDRKTARRYVQAVQEAGSFSLDPPMNSVPLVRVA
jgi:transposase